MKPSHEVNDELSKYLVLNDFEQEKETIFTKIRDRFSYHWRYKVEFPFKDFKNGIKNLWRFKKVIWKFRAWDSSYSLEVLRECLKRQREDIEKYSYSADKEQNELKQLNEVIEILNRIIEDNYSELVGINFDNIEWKFEKIEGTSFSEMKTEYKNGYTEEEYRRLQDSAIEMEKRDKKRFGQLMSKFEYWWY